MKQVNLFFIFCLLLPIAANAEKLGSIKLYKSHSGSPEIEMTLMRLGGTKERRILAYFKTPDFAINGEYNIYRGRCETTRCNKIIYKVIGGSVRNIVSNSGYFGNYFELLLSERTKPLSVYYDKKLSSKLNRNDTYNNYLASVGRNTTGNYNADKVTSALNAELNNLQKACHSKVKLNKNINEFKTSKLIHLVGMAAQMLQQITLKCTDADYREELTKIKTIDLKPVLKHTKMKLSGSKLTINLSETTYNPKYETRVWLDNL